MAALTAMKVPAGGVVLTGEDFQLAMRIAGCEISLEQADEWFEGLQARGLLRLDEIYQSTPSAGDIEEQVERLTNALAKHIVQEGLHELYRSEQLRKRLDSNTPPAPRPHSHAPRL